MLWMQESWFPYQGHPFSFPLHFFHSTLSKMPKRSTIKMRRSSLSRRRHTNILPDTKGGGTKRRKSILNSRHLIGGLNRDEDIVLLTRPLLFKFNKPLCSEFKPLDSNNAKWDCESQIYTGTVPFICLRKPFTDANKGQIIKGFSHGYLVSRKSFNQKRPDCS